MSHLDLLAIFLGLCRVWAHCPDCLGADHRRTPIVRYSLRPEDRESDKHDDPVEIDCTPDVKEVTGLSRPSRDWWVDGDLWWAVDLVDEGQARRCRKIGVSDCLWIRLWVSDVGRYHGDWWLEFAR